MQESEPLPRPPEETVAIVPSLKRDVTLPMLVLYGVGVAVGACAFVLIGSVHQLARLRAPLAFVLAAIVATATAFSCAILARGLPALRAPRSSGIARLERNHHAGFLGLLVAARRTAARENIGAAAPKTAIDVGVLVVLTGAGAPDLADPAVWTAAIGFAGPLDTQAILAAALLAFFARIGFEDIVNMAAETVEPERSAARAIFAMLKEVATKREDFSPSIE